jgi:hypothetical protein
VVGSPSASQEEETIMPATTSRNAEVRNHVVRGFRPLSKPKSWPPPHGNTMINLLGRTGEPPDRC